MNNGWKEKTKTMNDRYMYEGHDGEYDDVRGVGASYDFFETEFVNRFDGWSIPF